MIPNITIRADDLGMHPAIDEAIFECFDLGCIDEAAWMAVGTSSAPAAAGAKQRALPISVHITFASEWDLTRWGSLNGRLDLDDKALPATPTLLAEADLEDLVSESLAQIDRAYECGLQPRAFNYHIDCPRPELTEQITSASGLPCRDIALGNRPLPAYYPEYLSLTEIEPVSKMDALLGSLDRNSGRLCIVTHPGKNLLGLASLCSVEFGARRHWAVDYRLSDHHVLTDPKVVETITRARAA